MSSQPQRTVRVVVRQPQNEDGRHQEERTYENVLVDAAGRMHLYSDRPPEEAYAFGITLGPGENFEQAHKVKLVVPSERSITKDREDGLCIYCQVLLLPDAPEYAAHQPCMMLLVNNWDRCLLCKLINISIFREHPELKAKATAGEVDFRSTDTRVIVQSQKYDRFSGMVATVGDLLNSKINGAPIVWTTSKTLGKHSPLPEGKD